MNRRQALVCMSLLASSTWARSADWNKLHFTEVRTLAALPAPARQALSADGSGTTGIAEKGARYNSTDVLNPALPRRRFLVAGVDGDNALIALEIGGRGRHVEAYLVQPEQGYPVIKDQWSFNSTPKTLAALLETVERYGRTDVATKRDAERIAKEYFKLHVGCGTFEGISETPAAWNVEGKFGFAGTPIKDFTIDKKTGRIRSSIGPSYADEAEMKRQRRHPLK